MSFVFKVVCGNFSIASLTP
nr:DUF3265 domain-containing protein [Vibrio parahaemolyticus]